MIWRQQCSWTPRTSQLRRWQLRPARMGKNFRYAPPPTPTWSVVARAIYDRREGKGAFAIKKRPSEAEECAGLLPAFKACSRDARAAIAAMERK